MSSEAPASPPPDPPAVPPAAPEKESAGVTRAGALWVALTLGFLVLIVLLVFILQNMTSTEIVFLGWHQQLPVGVAILFAAVGGGLLAVAVGAVRMVQLRRAAKRPGRASR